jgi:PTH1 family peptidyl-tRNA hydrolase
MNLSGESLVEAANFYKIPRENIIVIYDDISLAVGRMRVRPEGSAGGHNGIKNIILHLSSEVFPRIKVGVGQPQGGLIPYVLGKFPKEEREVLEKLFSGAVEAAETIIKDGITEAMNRYNGFKVE